MTRSLALDVPLTRTPEAPIVGQPWYGADMRTPSWLLLAPTLWVGLAATAQTLVPNDLVLDRRYVTGVSGAVAAEFLPDGRLVIIRQTGQIAVRPAAGGALIQAGSLSVNVSSERGLLGLAVDPQFATSNRLYFYYSASNGNADARHRVGWATIDPVTSMVNTAGLTDILVGMMGPANHNGGGITFGPDGYLYVGVGDTGCNCNCAPGRADNWFPTCLTNLNGKILRVDRDGGIPATNPLVGQAMVPACGANARPENSNTNGCNAPLYQTQVGAPRTEIYNWGFRNPWRFSFDPLTGHLWIGDVGEVTWEEITISTGPGQHHGWPFREGTAGDPVNSCATATPQGTGDCVEPAYAYAHNGGAGSVSGGVFTTHCSWPAAYQGLYWFSDYTTDQRAIWSIQPNAARDGVVPNSRADIITNAEGIVHFTNGPDGALYLINASFGQVWRLAPMNPVVCTPDAGVPADSGVHPDAAPGPMDADLPDVAPPADTGVAPPADTGVAPADTGVAPPADTGVVPPADTGVTPTADTGVPVTNPDATAAGADAGVARADASGSGTADEGCGCATTQDTAGAPWALLALVGLALARRRR